MGWGIYGECIAYDGHSVGIISSHIFLSPFTKEIWELIPFNASSIFLAYNCGHPASNKINMITQQHTWPTVWASYVFAGNRQAPDLIMNVRKHRERVLKNIFAFNASANASDAGDGTLGLLTFDVNVWHLMLMSDAIDLRRLPRLGELGISAAARGRDLSSALSGVYWDYYTIIKCKL